MTNVAFQTLLLTAELSTEQKDQGEGITILCGIIPS